MAQRSNSGDPTWVPIVIRSLMPQGVERVTFWGALAMALTAGVGAMFGATI